MFSCDYTGFTLSRIISPLLRTYISLIYHGSYINFVFERIVKKNTGSIYDCTVNDVITSYMHTTTISSHQRYSRMIKGAHSLRLCNMSPRHGPQTVTSRVAVWQLRHIGHPAVTSCLTLARSRCGSYVI